ncbi:MAG: ROK family protein [Pirellulales bacterium]|nr:ROK family protein [Pirellulales bacterium]
MNILVIDVGGTNVKVWKTEEAEKVKFPSGRDLTPQTLLEGVREATEGWPVERVSIGYPGDVRNGRPIAEPYNLGDGWVDFDFVHAFDCPVRIMNDACLQALGSYDGGRMLYLGLGTSIGTAFITDGVIVPLALGHPKLWEGETFEHYLGRAALTLHGKKRWRQAVAETAAILKPAFLADYIVLGGGNADELKEMPPGCRRGGNHNAYFGGLRMWEDIADSAPSHLAVLPKVAAETA